MWMLNTRFITIRYANEHAQFLFYAHAYILTDFVMLSQNWRQLFLNAVLVELFDQIFTQRHEFHPHHKYSIFFMFLFYVFEY